MIIIDSTRCGCHTPQLADFSKTLLFKTAGLSPELADSLGISWDRATCSFEKNMVTRPTYCVFNGFHGVQCLQTPVVFGKRHGNAQMGRQEAAVTELEQRISGRAQTEGIQ